MPAAMTEGEVEDPAVTDATFVQHRDLRIVPLGVAELGTATGEARSEQRHERRIFIGAVDLAVVGEAQQRIGAVEREPAAAALEPAGDRFGLGGIGDEVAGVGDEQVGGDDPVGVGIVAAYRGADRGMASASNRA